MKKTSKKLALKAVTIRDLTAGEADRVAGGWSLSCSDAQQSCGPSGCVCSVHMCTTTYAHCGTWTC